MMSDRRVHACNSRWELVRYARAGEWRLEWVGPERLAPNYVEYVVDAGWPGYVRMVRGRRSGRLAANQLAEIVQALRLVPRVGVPGGAVFDRECRKAGATDGE